MAGPGVGVFGCTLDQVYGLCPEAERVTDANQSELNSPITEATVTQWILDLDAQVSAGIGGWATISEPLVTGIKAAAAAVVANGAASYLEAARYPTRASLNDSTYSGVLWERYQAGLTALAARVTAILDDGGPGVQEPAGGGAAAYFPPPYFREGQIW